LPRLRAAIVPKRDALPNSKSDFIGKESGKIEPHPRFLWQLSPNRQGLIIRPGKRGKMRAIVPVG
jgi:hypothetical protein